MDISSLRERRDTQALTVTELNNYIKNLLEFDRSLRTVYVRGEISNFKSHTSGHLYFTIKDKESQIKAVMFRSSAVRLKFMPEDGMLATVTASVGVYTQGGSYQLYVTSIIPDGVGALYMAYEQLKNKLELEGLFSEEYKKDIPQLPRRIGVITSPTGAAIRDIINTVGRRFPIAEIYLYPSLVQGVGAEQNLVEALEYFDTSKLVDVIIIGRGGGSIEDLWAFNSENLARTIFKCQIPVISAVGHETDFTICDFVADCRAATPTAAAELSVPDSGEVIIKLDNLLERVVGLIFGNIERAESRLEYIKLKLSGGDKMFVPLGERLASLKQSLLNSMERIVSNKTHQISALCGKLNALSPLATIERGYSVVKKSGNIVKTINDASSGDNIDVVLSDGELICEVVNKRKK